MDTSFDQDFRTDINSDSDSNLQDNVNNRLFEDSVNTGGKQPAIGAGSAAETKPERSNPSDGKKPPPFEIVDEKDPEAKRDAAIRAVAKDIKNGKFTDEAKTLLLEALNTGNTDAARRKSLTAYSGANRIASPEQGEWRLRS